ncbi:hypothetical protein NARC_40148 [Candidatus Nitrosocosmicus arcticus]|uniref:Uncharacterized protein n=1 Tax=Candidatus Nitrosocosmicus arcticus TaxID=2035267 RepID=A0A557SX53_9ARCH|nr:hypothetical protein NARC_40148 [Candidatus Nitrosocosmicus arcticus]
MDSIRSFNMQVIYELLRVTQIYISGYGKRFEIIANSKTKFYATIIFQRSNLFPQSKI